MEDKALIKKSKHLSKLLRHDPEDLEMSDKGYIPVADIIEKLNITLEQLDHIVEENNKKRFEFNHPEHKTHIRARQGHTIDVDVDLVLLDQVPDFLYHGTSKDKYDIIKKDGVLKMKRTHVHLSGDVDTATNVAKRHGIPVIFKINARHMRADGCKIYQSANGVYLTEYVHPKYFI